MKLRLVTLPFLALFNINLGFSQVNSQRLTGLIIGESLVFTGGLYGLGKAWYKQPKAKFHTFNDLKEWQQIDKLGHSFWAFQMANLSLSAYKWTGLSNEQSAYYAGLNGFVFQAPIEIMDGFSPDYGFSLGDMAANISGSALYVSQQITWGETRISPKFSWHPTSFAKQRPELLGKNYSEQWLKDYNGQTYWLSANIASFEQNQDSKIPKYLNMAFGYSIENMIAADPEKSKRLGRKPIRQFFFSPDLDLTRIKTDSDFLRGFLFLANMLKIPAPALEVQIRPERPRIKIKFHAIYF